MDTKRHRSFMSTHTPSPFMRRTINQWYCTFTTTTTNVQLRTTSSSRSALFARNSIDVIVFAAPSIALFAALRRPPYCRSMYRHRDDTARSNQYTALADIMCRSTVSIFSISFLRPTRCLIWRCTVMVQSCEVHMSIRATLDAFYLHTW